MNIPKLPKVKVSLPIKITLQKPTSPPFAAKLITKLQAKYPFLKDFRVRAGMVAGASIFIFAEVAAVLQPYFTQHVYALGQAGSLLMPIVQPVADKLSYDSSQQEFQFNNGYTLPEPNSNHTSGVQIKATAHQDLSKGVSVTDTVNKVDFTMTPRFGTWSGKQDGNRLVYPLKNGTGWAVYSMHSIGVKEDILLKNAPSDKATFDYKLGLGSGLAARLQSDGSLGIYGNTLLSGNVSTGSAKDAALLQKARENAPKNKLLFSIPKPTVKALNPTKTGVSAAYVLDGDDLKIAVSGLSKANYPLTIDPSIYVSSAQQFMAGNDETNIDFDVADELIQKGSTTGAMFNSWDSALALNSSAWGQGVAVAGGNIYVVGGTHTDGSTTFYTSPGTDSFTVPTGITSVTIKAWGAGGGGGGGGTAGSGGAGGGGGYTKTTVTVSPGDSLSINVGAGGGAGSFSSGASGSSSGDGGGGGGYSGVVDTTTSTTAAVAAGGAGGGGGGASGNSTYNGGAGGAGGGTSGVDGSASGGANGGGGGTASAGGAGGTGGGNGGSAGSSLTGGAGADGRSGAGADGSNANGGSPGGANGGNGDQSSNDYAGAGGGGGGYYGGGGGSGTQKTGNGSHSAYSGGGGGGGGSSYTSGTNVTNTAGSGTTPGNSSDGSRGSAGDGGGGGSTNSSGTSGNSGLVIITYGSGSTDTTTVNWAQFNTGTGAIQSADPGAGACSGWCANSAYALPVARSNLSVVAYNGFLYAIGGEDSNCTSANSNGDGGVCNTVYIAKLGVNGEPQLWSPTSVDSSTWTYWYRDTDLSSPRSYIAAVAYENRMYLLGGKTSSGGTPSITNTAEVADITPTGQLGSWASTTTLPYNVYGYGAQIYNSRIYLVGGSSSIGGTPLDTVYYNKINSDGSLNTWKQTTSLVQSGSNNGRFTNGGNFTTAWGGYIYLSGGCSGVNASGYCTGEASDTQLASINADGSLDQWRDDTNVSDGRMGHNLVAWQNYIYEIGGCTSQSATTGECSNALNTINYGTINSDGDISSVTQSVASGTSPCSGGSPTNCDLPSTTYVGHMLNATAVINGYVYVAGGCANAACTSIAKDTAYAAIGDNGALNAPANCATDGNTLYGSWCVDSTRNINPGNQGNGNTGVAAAGTAVFGNTIYFVGGLNGNGLTGVIYHVSVNSDGSLNSSGWSYDSMTTAGATSVAYDYAYARANPASAGTSPGNLFILGGCTALSGAACSTYTGAVYKCNISTSTTVSACSTTNQLQIGTVAGASGAGLAGTGGAVYANYMYLIGGQAPGVSALSDIYYAKIDNSNNIVAVSGSAWAVASNQTPTASAYATAFGYNGYLYVIGGYNSTNGVLDTVAFAKIDVSSGDVGAFTTSGTTIGAVWGVGIPVTGSYAQVLGGCTAGSPPSSCSNLQATVQTFQIYNNDSGSTSSFSLGNNPGVDRIGGSAAVMNGYIYYAGGCTNMACSTLTKTTYYAPIGADGVVGTWSSGGTLPGTGGVAWGKLVNAGGTLYYVGGQTGSATTTAQATVYYSSSISSGNPTWGTASNGLPAARTQMGVAVWNNRIYVAGGYDSSGSVTSTVYASPQQNSGGDISSSWPAATTSFNVARSGLTVMAYANNLYVVSGYDGSNYLSDVQYSQISTTDGSVGSWSYTTSLPSSLSGADGFVSNGYMYVIGGTTDGTACLPSTYVAPISANTTIASGNNPTGVGTWFQDNQNYSGDRYGAAAVYSGGKAYVLGGGCSSTIISHNSPDQWMYYASLLSQPQVAQYSIMFDTDSDVYPNHWLINGVDNSIGAKWQMSYRSMSNPYSSGPNGTGKNCSSSVMSTWGQTTNTGDVTLGTPGTYTPLDGSGTDMNCARYYYVSVTVDSSKAYGYPDDVTRGPTITDLTIQFTADPSKRLMHGRTFIGGVQEPDDTPYYSN
jgi:N-acetylneuraminic acid mutarotase